MSDSLHITVMELLLQTITVDVSSAFNVVKHRSFQSSLNTVMGGIVSTDKFNINLLNFSNFGCKAFNFLICKFLSKDGVLLQSILNLLINIIGIICFFKFLFESLNFLILRCIKNGIDCRVRGIKSWSDYFGNSV